MRYIKYFYCLVFLGMLHSCNVVGNDLEKEVGLSTSSISTIDNVSLKKGEEVVIWTKSSLEYKTYESPDLDDYSIKYYIEKDKDSMLVDRYLPLVFSHFIKSSKEEESDTETRYNDDNEEEEVDITRVTSEYEAESGVYVVPEDGNYSFSFKLYSKDNISFYSRGRFSIKLRTR
ncbi:hypothetical protein [Algibacter sp. L4_22]|uniref:hypothetical protein n=1 Tax=Algibacter sp. L4_22 TaxID=2942477 RepID=UPI00201B79DE|nr:hypothetical protein [Algibacter sp. L4_22]MCL5128591.1 hypothetical protein [Algibacter sp. L4_22]